MIKKILGVVEVWSGGKLMVVSDEQEKLLINEESYGKLLPGDKVIGEIVEENFFLNSILPNIVENLVCKKTKFGYKIIERGFANFFKNISYEVENNTGISDFKNGSCFIVDVVRGEEGKTVLKLKEYVGLEYSNGIETEIAIKKYGLSNFKNNFYINSKVSQKPTVSTNLELLPFFTIDDITTKDIDDALFAEHKDNQYHIYVAIADVSKYITKDSYYDQISKDRTSSVYMSHYTMHMLPEELSTKICSLNPNEKKSVVVIKSIFDEKFNLLNYEILRSEIISKKRFSYEEVDSIINKEEIIKNKKIENALTILHNFSQHVNQNHKNNLKDYGPEYKFILNDKGKIDKIIEVQQDSPAHKLVENSMSLANKLAAKFMFDSTHTKSVGVYRNQQAPIFEEEKEISQPSIYSAKNEGHYGLNLEHYTHFTSPIRRYCDLVVHRLLLNIIDKKPLEYSEDELVTITENINVKQKQIRKATRLSEDLLFSDYVKRHIGEEHDFQIMEQLEKGIVINSSDLKIEGFVMWTKLSDDEQLNIKENQQKSIRLKIKSYDELSNKTIFESPQFVLKNNIQEPNRNFLKI